GIRDDLVTGVQTCALPIFVNSGGVFVGLERDQSQVRAKNFLPNAAQAGFVLDPIDERRQVASPGMLGCGDTAAIEKNFGAFLAKIGRASCRERMCVWAGEV